MIKIEYGDCLSLSGLDYKQTNPPRECQEDKYYCVWLDNLGRVYYLQQFVGIKRRLYVGIKTDLKFNHRGFNFIIIAKMIKISLTMIKLQCII